MREIMPYYCEYGKPRACGDDPERNGRNLPCTE